MADGDKNRDIVFRRIRGRIVPIRVKRSRSTGSDSVRRKATGVAVAASAFGVAAVGGAAQKKFQMAARKARRTSFRARGLADVVLSRPGRRKSSFLGLVSDRKRIEKLTEVSRKSRVRSKELLKTAKRGRFFTIAAAGSLLGAGLQQLSGGRPKTPEGQAAASFVANIAGTAITGAFILGRKKLSFARLARVFGQKKKLPKEPKLFDPLDFFKGQ